FPSLAVDANGGVHVAYGDMTGSRLKLAHRLSAGTWTIESIDEVGLSSDAPSLSLDAASGLHIAYSQADPASDCIEACHPLSNLRYRYRAAGDDVWSGDAIQCGANNAYQPSLTIDPGGDVHVAYYADDVCGLKHARRSP